MDQLVKEESQKLLAKQMQQARIQRQIQVRQQALAWSDAKRKRFEKAKEAAIKKLATQVTEQAQNTAIQNIQRLNQLNDLAMAEIGMAHRAAAGYQNVERLKSLKRLKNEEVAKNRGASAMMKLSKEREELVAKSSAILNRKKEVREMEDRKAQEIINIRKPLSLTNIDTKSSKAVIGPPEYQQSLAKTLSTIDSSSEPDRVPSKKSSVLKSQSRTSAAGTTKSRTGVPVSSSQDLLNKERDKERVKHDVGMLDRMVRIKTTDGILSSDHPELNLLPTFSTRANNMRAVDAGESSNPLAAGAVRYFDTALPKGEVKYIPPKGLAVKESRSDSPDAWAKGRQLSEQLLQEREERSRMRLEMEQRQRERSERAILEEKLSKEKMELENQIRDIMDPENMPLDVGSQRGIFEMEEANYAGAGGEREGDVDRGEVEGEDQSSEDFLAVETDEEFAFPGIDAPDIDRQQSQPTMKTYAVRAGSIDPEGDRRRDSQPVKYILSSTSSSSSSTSSLEQEIKSSDRLKNASSKEMRKQRETTAKEQEQKLREDLQRILQMRSESVQTQSHPPSSHHISPPAEGPYHSTPDGKLKYHPRDADTAGKHDETQERRPISAQEKADILKSVVEGVISKRPESIEKMQVESSSDVSRIEIGSDMVEETPKSSPERSDEYSFESKSRDSNDRSRSGGSGESELSFKIETKDKKRQNHSSKKLEGKKKSSQKRPSRESLGSIVTSKETKDKDSDKHVDNQGSAEDFLAVESDEEFIFPDKDKDLSDKQPLPKDEKSSASASKASKKKSRGIMGMRSEHSILEYALSLSESATSVKSVDKVQSRHSQSKKLESEEGSGKGISETTKDERKHSKDKSGVEDQDDDHDVKKRLSSSDRFTPVMRPSYDHTSPPAEGPFHSTPDGKLQQHHRRSSESQEQGERAVGSEEKAKILNRIMTDMLNKRRQSIDAIQIEPSMNMSRVKVDSDMYSETATSSTPGGQHHFTSTPVSQSSGGGTSSSVSGSSRGSKRKEGSRKLSSKENLSESREEKRVISGEAKAKFLKGIMQDLISKKPESMDKIPLDVSSNMSRLLVDSDVFGETSSSTPGQSIPTPLTSTATSCQSNSHSEQTPSTSGRSDQKPTSSTPDDSQSSGGSRRKCKKAKKTSSKEKLSDSKSKERMDQSQTKQEKGEREPREKRVLSAEAKTEFLRNIMQGMISRQPRSIEEMPLDVSSNASRLVVDSDFFGDTSRTPHRPDPNETSVPGSGSNRGSGSRPGSIAADLGARTKSNLDEHKRRIIAHYFSKMVQRKPESIEKLPVTVSSSSILQVDSEIPSQNDSSSSVHHGDE